MSLGLDPLGTSPLGTTVPRLQEKESTAGGIPLTAPNVPESGEAPEVKLYKISFEKYKSSECTINGMDSVNAHAALIVLRDVGIYYSDEESYKKSSSQPIVVKYVEPAGEYAVLYKGLVDEEVYEIKLVKDQKEKKVDIRMFYTTLESEKIFYLIAARHTHYDTTKGDYDKRARLKKLNNRPFKKR